MLVAGPSAAKKSRLSLTSKNPPSRVTFESDRSSRGGGILKKVQYVVSPFLDGLSVSNVLCNEQIQHMWRTLRYGELTVFGIEKMFIGKMIQSVHMISLLQIALYNWSKRRYLPDMALIGIIYNNVKSELDKCVADGMVLGPDNVFQPKCVLSKEQYEMSVELIIQSITSIKEFKSSKKHLRKLLSFCSVCGLGLVPKVNRASLTYGCDCVEDVCVLCYQRYCHGQDWSRQNNDEQRLKIYGNSSVSHRMINCMSCDNEVDRWFLEDRTLVGVRRVCNHCWYYVEDKDEDQAWMCFCCSATFHEKCRNRLFPMTCLVCSYGKVNRWRLFVQLFNEQQVVLSSSNDFFCWGAKNLPIEINEAKKVQTESVSVVRVGVQTESVSVVSVEVQTDTVVEQDVVPSAEGPKEDVVVVGVEGACVLEGTGTGLLTIGSEVIAFDLPGFDTSAVSPPTPLPPRTSTPNAVQTLCEGDDYNDVLKEFFTNVVLDDDMVNKVVEQYVDDDEVPLMNWNENLEMGLDEKASEHELKLSLDLVKMLDEQGRKSVNEKASRMSVTYAEHDGEKYKLKYRADSYHKLRLNEIVRERDNLSM